MEFDQVRVQILGKEDLPSLNETISMIRVEEERRGVMMNETPIAESSVLLSTARNLKNSGMEHQPGADNWRLYFSQITNKNPIWCTYCKKQ